MTSSVTEPTPTRYVVALAHPDLSRQSRLRELLDSAGYQVVPLGIDGRIDAQLISDALPGGLAHHALRDLPTLVLTERPRTPAPGRFAPTDSLPDDDLRDQELLLRTAVLCRRGRLAAVALTEELDLDDTCRTARTPAGTVTLTAVEHRLLRALAARIGDVAPRAALVAIVWPTGVQVARNTLDSHVRRLRSKLTSIGAPLRVETVHGLGFRLVPGEV